MRNTSYRADKIIRLFLWLALPLACSVFLCSDNWIHGMRESLFLHPFLCPGVAALQPGQKGPRQASNEIINVPRGINRFTWGSSATYQSPLAADLLVRDPLITEVPRRRRFISDCNGSIFKQMTSLTFSETHLYCLLI